MPQRYLREASILRLPSSLSAVAARFQVQDQMRRIVADKGMVDPTTGEQYVISNSFVRGWVRKHHLRGYKTSGIHCSRAAKATLELRDHFFGMVDDYVKQMHNEDPQKWRWKSFDELPDTHKYNMDEEGADTAKGRPPALAAARVLGQVYLPRLYDIPTDGQMAFHVTDAMTTRADGQVGAREHLRLSAPPAAFAWPPCVRAALQPPDTPDARAPQVCAPFIIKSVGGGKRRKHGDAGGDSLPNIMIEDFEHLGDEGAEDGQETGIGIAVESPGSMTKDLFRIWSEHFVEKVLAPRTRSPAKFSPEPLSSHHQC